MTIGSNERGLSRSESLLLSFYLTNRLKVDSGIMILETIDKEISWQDVSLKLMSFRSSSNFFLASKV